jgi:hypothetical protein
MRIVELGRLAISYCRMSKHRTVAGIRYSIGAREAIATSVTVTGICTSDVKATRTKPMQIRSFGRRARMEETRCEALSKFV